MIRILLFRNRRRKQRIRQVGAGPVESPVRHFLQADPGADRLVSGYAVGDRQRAQGDPVRGSGRPGPFRPAPQEVVPDGVLRHLQGDGPVGGLQPVDDNIPVRRSRMGRQVPRRRDHDLPHPALVQVGGADVRVVQDGLAVRKRINVVCHEPEPPF